jgi:hypothetical protein
MSGRIAHRPRYRNLKYLYQPSSRTRKDFFRTRWTYRAMPPYQKPKLGQGLALIPFYHFVHGSMLR